MAPFSSLYLNGTFVWFLFSLSVSFFFFAVFFHVLGWESIASDDAGAAGLVGRSTRQWSSSRSRRIGWSQSQDPQMAPGGGREVRADRRIPGGARPCQKSTGQSQTGKYGPGSSNCWFSSHLLLSCFFLPHQKSIVHSLSTFYVLVNKFKSRYSLIYSCMVKIWAGLSGLVFFIKRASSVLLAPYYKSLLFIHYFGLIYSAIDYSLLTSISHKMWAQFK